MARIVVVAVVVEVGLRLSTLPRLARVLRVRVSFEREMPKESVPAPLPVWALRRLDLVRAVLRTGPSGPTCLRVCLVGAQRLHRLAPSLRIGVRRDDGEFLAHAWLEISGRSLDPGADAFRTMVRLDD